MSATPHPRHSLCTVLMISCLAASGSLAESSDPGLIGSVHCAYYRHPSGVFRIMVSSPGGIRDSQTGVTITRTFMGSIAQWNDVAFVNPESSSKSPDQILDAMMADLTTGLYAKTKHKPTIRLREIKSAFGENCLHAKIDYPEYPGTGVTTFSSKGKQVAADVVGHVHIIPVADLSSSKTGLPVRYILVGTMVVTVLDRTKDEGESAHYDFMRRFELTTTPGGRTYDPADTLTLLHATAAGDVPAIERLLASGADVNAANDGGVTPLVMASTTGCTDAVRALLEKAHGTEITADTTRLARVALSGHSDIMLMLLEHGFRTSAVDPITGWTPLLAVAHTSDVGMARVLLDHGADAELRSSAKPLIGAAGNNQVEMVNLLIERGADVNRKDESGKTALSAASGNKEIKKILKQAGAR